MKCNIMKKCANTHFYTSAVQFFAVQGTSVVVASDWPSPAPIVTQNADEQPIEVVDLHALYLVHNTPHAEGERVLDVGSPGGVLGLAAARSGAKEVIQIQPDSRA